MLERGKRDVGDVARPAGHEREVRRARRIGLLDQLDVLLEVRRLLGLLQELDDLAGDAADDLSAASVTGRLSVLGGGLPFPAGKVGIMPMPEDGILAPMMRAKPSSGCSGFDSQ